MIDEESLRKKVAHKIKEIRLSRGLSQKQLGGLAGMTMQRIHSLEVGEKTPRIVTLAKIADGLGVSVFDILDEPLGRTCKVCANSSACPFFKPV